MDSASREMDGDVDVVQIGGLASRGGGCETNAGGVDMMAEPADPPADQALKRRKDASQQEVSAGNYAPAIEVESRLHDGCRHGQGAGGGGTNLGVEAPVAESCGFGQLLSTEASHPRESGPVLASQGPIASVADADWGPTCVRGGVCCDVHQDALHVQGSAGESRDLNMCVAAASPDSVARESERTGVEGPKGSAEASGARAFAFVANPSSQGGHVVDGVVRCDCCETGDSRDADRGDPCSVVDVCRKDGRRRRRKRSEGKLEAHARFLQYLFRRSRHVRSDCWRRGGWRGLWLFRPFTVFGCRNGLLLASEGEFTAQKQRAAEVLGWYSNYVRLLKKWRRSSACT